MRRCRGCNAPLGAVRSDAVWCSDACRVARYREVQAVQSANITLPGLQRLKPSTRRVLSALTAAGERGLTTAQLCQPGVGGVRFGARVLELRSVGFTIAASQERPGSYRYKLIPSIGEVAA